MASICSVVMQLPYDMHHQNSECTPEINLSTIEIVIPSYDPLFEEVRLDEQFASYRGTIQERDQEFQPTIITYPKSAEEVQDIVNFASLCNYKISVRSGGHQYSGLSSCNRLNNQCIQIDMKYFNHTIYNKDDKTDNELITSITVGVSVRLGDLSVSNTENNVAIIHGVCKGVAAGGHYQSSSHGAWSRSLGLGMDWIFRIRIITADGIIRDVFKDSKCRKERDLFWAILGGSPGSFGVIIEYEFIPIYDNDYPYSSYYAYTQIYADEYYHELYTMIIDLLNNEYYKLASDLTVYSVIKQIQTDPDNALTHFGYHVFNTFSWSGNKYGDINNLIPDHPENKTWYQELVKPFKDIGDRFSESKLQDFEAQHLTISQTLALVASGEEIIDVPPFRYYNTHSAYKQDVFDGTIFKNETLKSEWIDLVIAEISKLTSNDTDNIELLFQIQYLVPSQDDYWINDNLNIKYDPLENGVSFPTRDVPFQVDAWILFGNDDESNGNADRAKQASKDLKDVLNLNQVNDYIINAFGYTDRSMQEYLEDPEFDYFFPERSDVFEKLMEIKTKVDCKDIFHGAITIPSNNENCD